VVRIDSLSHGVECLKDYFVHLRHQVIVYTHATFWVVLIDILLELWERKHVSVLVVSVIFSMLLNSIVCQVDKCIVDVLQVDSKFSGRRPKVPFFEEVQILVLRENNPHSDVEFSFVDQQGSFNVLLDDKRIVLDFVRS